jgi:hypothetical protein
MDTNKTDRTIMTKYAVIPEGTDMEDVIFLTVGERYPLLEGYRKSNLNDGLYFEIVADNKIKIRCLELNCWHLNRQNWEIQ